QLKKIIVVVAAILAVVVIAFIVDGMSNKINDPIAAENRIYAEGLIAKYPDVTNETGMTIETLEPEKIEGKLYYLFDIVLDYESETPRPMPRIYVRAKDGLIFSKDDATGQMLPWNYFAEPAKTP
ncbi:MAG: hypothetical protein RR185_08160, partial [Angelakisella sp.]